MAEIKFFHLAPITIFLLLQACLADNQGPQNPKPCSTLWYQQVETTLLSQDSSGHGPDLGSQEWKSVIEFKLGIRGNPGIPDRTTGDWCNFIEKELK